MGFVLDEQTDDEDLIFESHGINLVYNKEFEAYFKGLTLDYSEKWYKRGYNFVNK